MQIALVMGGSRGAAIGLAEAGFKVFATGRSIETANLPAAVVRVRCDHMRDEDTARVDAESGGLDVLVNSAWGGYDRMVEDGQFTWVYGVAKAATDKMSADMALSRSGAGGIGVAGGRLDLRIAKARSSSAA